MRLDVFFTPVEAESVPTPPDATVVVIDVVRATTSMVEALANGARGIYPTASTEEAVKLVQSLGREDTLLAGERKGAKIEGFDLGNSPREFTADVVGDTRLVWTTTNGTAAFASATVQDAERVVACAFTNLSAVARAVASDASILIQCAGREDRFALDDALCAGMLASRILEATEGERTVNDGARAVMALADGVTLDAGFLARCESGRALAAIGLEDDLKVCAELDRHDVVPQMREQALVVLARA